MVIDMDDELEQLKRMDQADRASWIDELRRRISPRSCCQPQPAGGNVTGITNLGSELEPKRLRDAHEMVPSAARFAVLVNPNRAAGLCASCQ